jgi:hypothetical protein
VSRKRVGRLKKARTHSERVPERKVRVEAKKETKEINEEMKP